MASPIEEIKSRLSVVELIGSYLRLQKAGANFKALCPFHNEKTPSFYVSPAREIWHCFGCGAGGDIFRFVGQIEGVEFPEALELLAGRAGVQLKKEDPRLATERRRLFSLLEEAAKFYEAELLKRKEVLAYLKARGLKDETVKNFRLGFAPQGWEGVLGHLMPKGFRGEEIERAGLAIVSQRPEAKARFYDRFRSRIMFPIADGSGRVIGFSGRIFGEETGEGKYINSPQTILFDKSRVLYLWDKAKNEIRQKDACLLVEGQLDAVMSHQAGVKNAVAASGTALGQGHLDLIKRLTSKLYLAFDADLAGEAATRRGVDLVLARGFEVNLIELPKGQDPAELVQENPGRWQEAVRQARPIIAFFLNLLKKKFPEDLRRLRSEANSLVLPYIAALENEIERAHWVQETAQVMGLKEEPVWAEVRKLGLKNRKEILEAQATGTSLPPKTRRDLLEERILGMLVWKRGEFLEKFDKKTSEFFSEHRQPLLQCVFSEKFPAGAQDLKQNLEKLSLEAELLYGEMERVHEEFHLLLSELEKENLKSRLEELASEIRRQESAGQEGQVRILLAEFGELSKKLLNHGQV